MNAPTEDEIHGVWSDYWSSVEQVADWDSLSEVILGTIGRESQGLEGCAIMEAGCGTGRISRRLAQAGGQVCCLDITSEALEHARTTFGDVPGSFVQGSILDLPKDQHYDLVWNAGVLEHFTVADQELAIGQFLEVLSPQGRVVILTPYSRSLFYRIGKFVLELLNKWPYGTEIPKSSLQDCLPAGAVLQQEYTMAFIPLIIDSYKFLTPLRRPMRALWRLLIKMCGLPALMEWDLFLSRIFGGYLLVSVISRRGGSEKGANAPDAVSSSAVE